MRSPSLARSVRNDAVDGTCPDVCEQYIDHAGSTVASGDGCNRHLQCEAGRYCDSNHDCYTCSYCTTVHNDAVDGTCPDTCDAFTTADPNADGTCHSHSECGHNGDTHTYCDSANTCYACDYCVK